MIYVNKIGNRITFKIKTGYYLELLTPEIMKLLGSIKSKITKDGNGEDVSHRVLHTIVPNILFGQLLDVSPKNFVFWKTFNSEFSYIEVWFTDQNSKVLEIEDKIKITLVINQSVKYKKWEETQFNLEIEFL